MPLDDREEALTDLAQRVGAERDLAERLEASRSNQLTVDFEVRSACNA